MWKSVYCLGPVLHGVCLIGEFGWLTHWPLGYMAVYFQCVMFKHIVMTDILRISYDVALVCMPQNAVV